MYCTSMAYRLHGGVGICDEILGPDEEYLLARENA